jgi:putative heme-binding domain-containing protein
MRIFGLFATIIIVLTQAASAQTPEWIWFNKTSDAETRFFRKAVSIEGKVTKAELVATADDALEVFVNGEPVLAAESWQNGHKADVAGQLKTGANILAIRSKNGDASAAGTIAQLTITTEKGRQVIVTDASWKAADRPVKDWNKPGFDDATWVAAKSLGKLGMEPWGQVFAATVAGSAKGTPKAEAKRVATPAEQLYVLKDFKVELLLSGEPEEGSWVNLCKDDKGRFILSPQYRASNPDGGLLRVTLGADGKVAKREFIAKPLYDAQGMVFAYGALWVVVNKYSTTFESGLYRITDDGSDTWSKIELVKKIPGGGEHGPHAVELGPDGNLWVMAGNHTKPPAGLSPDSPHKNYAEDHVLPRQPDGNGHATGIMAPGGYILRVNKEATKFDFFCGGFRNQYDFTFNVDGELFAWDADMEYDWGVPWYRATRINHAVSGAEFGWRFGTGKWPDYYADSLGSVVDIGIGCPTGVGNGQGAKFPAKFQRAMYAMDWTYGRLMAIHLKPEGASYTATWENFVAPAGLVEAGLPKPPLNVTDLVIGNDGAMYFTIGGRGTASGFYRVSYTGSESTAPALAPNQEGSAARALRHKIEAFHGQPNPQALDFIWPHLNSPDRAIRYAARIALEAQPVAQWQTRALAEKSADGGITALLALARLGGKSAQDEGLRALGRWPLATLSERQQLDKLRTIQVSIARHGLPSADVVKLATEKLGPSYPNRSDLVNRELAQVLIALGAPDVVEKTLTLMARATTQEEMMHYLFHLRTAKNWTAEQRREYFGYWLKDRKGYAHQGDIVKWFEQAGRPYGDGASFNNFLKNFLKEATVGLTAAEKEEFAPLLAAIAKGAPAGRKSASDFPAPKPRTTMVKTWTMADFASDLDAASTGRNFENGRQAFADAQCLACHRFGLEGGGVGPDLTAVSARFSRRDILESIIEPSKVLSEQYQNTTVWLKNGDDHTGRLAEETADQLVLIPNPLQPDNKIILKKADVTQRAGSKLSPMPAELANVLSKEDILDLLAFIESAGRRQHAAFQKKP